MSRLDESSPLLPCLVFVLLLAALVVLVAAVFSLSLSQYVVKGDDGSVAQGVLVAAMLSGIVIILFLYARNDVVSEPEHKPVRGSVREQLKYILRNYLSVVGMSFFYPFSCILDLYHILTAVSCDEEWRRCVGGSAPYRRYVFDVFFHLMRILFMGAELLFCIQFRNCHFKRRASVRCGLMIVMAVNLGLWFITLLYETYARDANHVKRNESAPCYILTEGNRTLRRFEGCFSSKQLEHVTGYLYPFTIEFSLLVGEYLADKFFRCKNQVDGTSAKSNSDRGTEEGGEERSGIRMLQTPEAANSQSSRRNDNDNSWGSDNNDNSNSDHMPCYTTSVLIVALGIFVNVISLTLYFSTYHGWWGQRAGELHDSSAGANDAHSAEPFNKTRLSIYTQKSQKEIEGVYRKYRCFYWLFVCLVTVVGFLTTSPFRIRAKKMRGLDYLVLLSVFGPLMQEIMTIVSLIWNLEQVKKRADPRVFLISETANLVQLILQVPFVFYADRVQFSVADRRRPHRLRIESTFKAIVIFMALCNITVWIQTSILVPSALAKSYLLQDYFKNGSWIFIDGIFRPLAIFFRFNSFLLFLRAYLGG